MKNLILCFFSFIILSCNDDDVEPVVTPPFVPVVIEPILISKRSINSTLDIVQQNTVFNSEINWNLLLNQFDAPFISIGLGNYFTESYFEETVIDFTNYTVIVVIDRIYGNGGHTIDITNITEFETTIVVTVENLQTGNGSSVVTQPYHIVKIPKATKPIVFE
ncbi:hypothetical protein [Flavobacterium sp.]|uniref:hypothetical protein n=1 Tax=Flavobacterium sp. TaxID=239 RepID=UPI0025BBAC91|nr:hypothetical protein [Flavobacterium sp.]MBA4155114.1 hypothetical protein [Flavobacterium sp.]